ncbi:MAG: aminotransferase class III-fold pyridoxal phosphate-dependent enzyme [Pseudobdellovibrionaceae bacterium]|nr:aminotransferase class III-fold pyridoxal phosphate-dependent enzyme [Bdellovibrionales bacterium]USN46917.1 MAG: aminotransferase class III-fold pyridoxal phosphate-dependent enzyme [Pseudobdellovibrionaceae bacterium]
MANLLGHRLSQSKEIEILIDKLVGEIQGLSSEVPATQSPREDCEENNNYWVEEAGKNRGRALFYPYIGTGMGRGPYVELEDGSVKLDLINGIGIHLLGHSHPEVIRAALRGSLSDMLVQGNLQANREYVLLAKKLVEIAGRKSRLKNVWLTTSGSMANENALKVCRQKTNAARKIIAMKSAFAGRTTMMAEVTDNPGFKQGLPEYHEVLRIPFYDKHNPKSSEQALNELKDHVSKNEGDVCCFTFEPMQGEGGYNVAPRQYFMPMLEFCRAKGIPVWVDEVQTFCRTGQFFAFETLDFGDYVDVCTVAKTLQNGATLWTEEFNPNPGLIAGTFAGSTPTLSVGLKILEILDQENYLGSTGKIAKIHNEFVGMLNRLNETTCEGLLKDAGGLGLMVAVTPLDGSRDKMNELLKVMYKNGLMTFGCGRGPFRLRFLLPAVMTSEDIACAGRIIEKSILEMA